MRSVRQHIIRIYEEDGGYTLYVGNLSSGLKRHSLDHESEQVSKSYFLAQRRLDDVLGTKRVPWSMTCRRDDRKSFPVFAYGSFMELPVEHGQSGIIFIHAIELNSPDDLYTCVNGVVTLLSNAGIRTLRNAILGVATGKASSNEQAMQIAQNLESLIAENHVDPDQNVNDRLRIRCVEQDCAGAFSIAWLSLALQQVKATPPWEVFDVIKNGENIVTTASSPDGEAMRASDIQRQSLRQYFSMPVEAHVSDVSPPGPEKIVDVGPSEDRKEPLDKGLNKSTETAQTENRPEKVKGRWEKISAVAPLITGILITCVSLYFVLSFNRQQRDLLNALNRIAENINPKANSVVTPDNNKVVTSAPTPQQNSSAPQQDSPSTQTDQQDNERLLRTIERMFAPSSTTRNTAIVQLRRDVASHEKIIPLALRYARQNQGNNEGVENTLLVFQNIKPESLKKHKDEILNFLDAVKDKDEKIATATGKVRLLLINNP